MRPIWKGTISFGLVSIPVSLYPATRREELKFRLLRAADLSPVNYKRVAEADGKEVPWEQIVKGYEYGLATKKRTQKLCNTLVNCFGFRSQWAKGSRVNCAGVGGCKTLL